MLELLFQGFLEWMYGLTLEAWEYFSSVLLDLMSLDFAYLRTHMPIIDTIMEIMLAVGWALLIGNLVFQAVKGMVTGLGFEAEDPKLLFTRTFVFAFLLLASPQICRIGLDMTSTVIELLEMPDAVDITFADEASFVGLTSSWLLVILCGIIVMFQTFKLIMEMAERYFVLAVLTITAPLAFGMGGSRNTSDIFTGWCRMFGSMLLLMALNVVFMKMLLSVLSFYPSGLDVLPWMVLVITVVKVAKKADSIISRIGLNPAMTGDSLGRGVPGALAYTVIRSMASNVARTVGKGGGRGAAASGSGPPNAPRTGGPSGSRAGTATNTSHINAQNSASQQTSVRNGSPQENSSQQTAQQNANTQQSASQHTNAQSSSSTGSAAQTLQANTRHHSSRNTSVPHGTRRSPSYVNQKSNKSAASSNSSAVQSSNSQNTQSVHAPQNQTTNIPAAVAAAVPAGSVVRGARNLPGKPSSGAKPVHASPAAASAPKQGTAKTPAPINGTTHLVSGNTQSAQQSIQNQNQQHSQQATSQNAAMAAPAQQEYRPAAHAEPVIHSANTPVSAGVPKAETGTMQPNSGTAGNKPATNVPAARSTGVTPGMAGTPQASIGGRYTQQETQAVRSADQSQSASSTQTKLSASHQEQTSARQSEMRSTNRERSPVPPQTSSASVGTHNGTQPHTAAPSQAPAQSKPADIRSTNRQPASATTPAEAVHAGSAPVVQAGANTTMHSQKSGNVMASSSPQTNVQVEQRSTQRSTVHSSASSPQLTGNAPTAQQEQSAAPKATTVPGTAPQTPNARQNTELRSSQRPPVSASSQPVPPSGGKSTPASARQASTSVGSSHVEQRATQRPATSPTPPAPAGNAPSSNTAPTQVSAGTPQQGARQSRNAAPITPATVVIGGDHTSPARQESRPSASATKSSPQVKRPVPAQQESPRTATGKKERPAPQHNGMAGTAPHSVPQRTPEIPIRTTAQQEQAPFPKKTFIPLSGKQPESIPSHLDLKQEPQKSTKRPADPVEGGSNVTE